MRARVPTHWPRGRPASGRRGELRRASACRDHPTGATASTCPSPTIPSPRRTRLARPPCRRRSTRRPRHPLLAPVLERPAACRRPRIHLAIRQEVLGNDLGINETLLLEPAQRRVYLADVERPRTGEQVLEDRLQFVTVPGFAPEQRQQHVLQHQAVP